jgi:hypothetical protein
LIGFVFRSLLAWPAASSRIYHKSEGDGTAPFTQLFDGLSSVQRLAVGTKTKSQTNLQVLLQDDMSVSWSWCTECADVLVTEEHRLTHRMAALTNFTAQFVVL